MREMKGFSSDIPFLCGVGGRTWVFQRRHYSSERKEEEGDCLHLTRG